MSAVAGRRACLRGAAALVVGAALPGCSNEPLARLAGSAFAAPAELLLWGLAAEQAARLAAGVWQRLAQFDRGWPPAPAAGSGTDLDLEWRARGLEDAATLLQLPDPGGALLTLGQHQLALGERGYRPWHVGIPDPANGRPLLGLDLYAGERLVTVGAYARYRRADGHTADTPPDAGAGACASCSVVVRAMPAVVAARLACLLYRAPQAGWPELALRLGAGAALWVGRDGSLEATTVLAKRTLPTDQRRRISERPGS